MDSYCRHASAEGSSSSRGRVCACPTIALGLSEAIEDARQANSGSKGVQGSERQPPTLVVVCGSAFIMPPARIVLGVKEPNDGDILYDLQCNNKNTTQQ